MEMRYIHVICLLLVSVCVSAQTDRVGILQDAIPNDNLAEIMDAHTSLLKTNDWCARWSDTVPYTEEMMFCL